LGRPFGFPDWPFLKRVCMSFRISSAIFVFCVPNVVAGRTAAEPVGDLFKSGVGADLML
jgi:hypothetical protein